MYSDAWPMPRGNMTRDFGPMAATLGGSWRGEPAEGMMVASALLKRDPAVSTSSDWFTLLHCGCAERRDFKQRERRAHEREKTDDIV